MISRALPNPAAVEAAMKGRVARAYRDRRGSTMPLRGAPDARVSGTSSVQWPPTVPASCESGDAARHGGVAVRVHLIHPYGVMTLRVPEPYVHGREGGLDLHVADCSPQR